jgi:predicted nucleic acid-binding protein
MSVFVDTNIFLRSVQPSHPLHGVAVSTVASLIALGTPLMVTPQIMAEFWNVASRPVEHNGLGFPHAQAHEELIRLEAFVVLLDETAEVYAEWKQLVVAHGITGVKVHDARLVAAMKAHGIGRLLTFNGRDFERYPGIEVLTPS